MTSRSFSRSCFICLFLTFLNRQILTNGILKTEHFEIHLSDSYTKIKHQNLLNVVVLVVLCFDFWGSKKCRFHAWLTLTDIATANDILGPRGHIMPRSMTFHFLNREKEKKESFSHFDMIIIISQ